MANEADSAGTAPCFDLTGQVALVTGAARGLGNACALALAHAGADVALGLREAGSAPELVQSIRAIGRRALPLQMDIMRRDQIKSAGAEAGEPFVRLDILVHQA